MMRSAKNTTFSWVQQRAHYMRDFSVENDRFR